MGKGEGLPVTIAGHLPIEWLRSQVHVRNFLKEETWKLGEAGIRNLLARIEDSAVAI